MDELSFALDGAPPQEAAPTGEPAPETTPAPETQPRDDAGRFAAKEPTPAAETVPPTVKSEPEPKTVPLAVVEDERRKRQEYERKVADYERRLAEYEAKQQEQRPDPVADPDAFRADLETRFQHQLMNERLNMSEQMARSVPGRDDFDTVAGRVMEAMRENPHLHAQAMSQPHPWEWVYKEGKRMQALAEIGDPAEYREKLRAELRAELEAELKPSQPQAAPVLPSSLAAARATGPRSGPTWRGPVSDSALGNPALC